MNKENIILIEILKICLSLDSKAYALYLKFASNCSNTSLTTKWMACAREEKQHIQFWKKALKLANLGELPEVFEDPEKIKASLILTEEKTINAISSITNFDDTNETLTMAYRLELFMLDSALMAMLNTFSFINKNIEEKYDEHIYKFIDMLQEYGGRDSLPHIELLGETLGNLYRRNRELFRENTIDPLTSLLNRRGFFNIVKPLMNLAERRGLTVAIIMGDIDNFKNINDTLGHPKGDEVITFIANMISKTIRKSDIAARYGGEEFIIFLNVKDQKSLETVCHRINEAISKNSLKSTGVKTTISLGGTAMELGTPDDCDLACIIDQADKNLLKAKESGKNCYLVS